MSKPKPLRSRKADFMSVIYRSTDRDRPLPAYHHAVVQTDLQFNITGWNTAAQEFYGQPGALGMNLFSILDIDFIDSSREEVIRNLQDDFFWSGEVLFRRHDDQQLYFLCTATYVINEKDTPTGIMVIGHMINEQRHKEQRLAAVEKKFEVLVNSVANGVMLINADAKITTCNKRGAEILGVTPEDLVGNDINDSSWKAIRADGSPFPVQQFPGIVSLQTGFPQRNVIMGIEQRGGMQLWLSVNSEALIKPGEFEPYGVVVSFTDISNFILAEKELKKSNERFYYITKVTSDAIWDLDLTTNQIYRSGAFSRLSGYTAEEIGTNLDWWLNKIHPEDRKRVKEKLDHELEMGHGRWEDEYRFEYSDGSYKILNDSGIILYKDGVAVRILGAIRDITEEKKLKKQLIEEQSLQQKAITMAAIKAQEQEKTKISCELHDNVNQILMSAKLYMDTAKRMPEEANNLLDKAIEYQLLALQEIRKLSRSLSAPGLATGGLQDSINDIVNNLRNLQQLSVEFRFDRSLEQRLSDAEKLTIYRVIQEQTNNIIKYSGAAAVKIELGMSGDQVRLTIADDGKGFDIATASKGIGLISMNSRAAAHNGNLSVHSLPGKGCTVRLDFPLSLL